MREIHSLDCLNDEMAQLIKHLLEMNIVIGIKVCFGGDLFYKVAM